MAPINRPTRPDLHSLATSTTDNDLNLRNAYCLRFFELIKVNQKITI